MFLRFKFSPFNLVQNTMNLSLTGMRIGPLDKETKMSAVGVEPEARTIANKKFYDQTTFVKKVSNGSRGSNIALGTHWLRRWFQDPRRVQEDQDVSQDKEICRRGRRLRR